LVEVCIQSRACIGCETIESPVICFFFPTMRKLVLGLSFFFFAGHGRRMHTTLHPMQSNSLGKQLELEEFRSEGRAEETKLTNALAKLLLTPNPAAGWNGGGGLPNGPSTQKPRGGVVSMQQPTKSAVLVSVDIKEDRISDFLKAMEDDVTKSRDPSLDAGCLRFDLLRDRENPNRFVFYEVYVDDDAAKAHKTTSHYQTWADFKASGGVENQVVAKIETSSIPGEWALQESARKALETEVKSAVLVTVEIKPDRVEEFFKAMEEDIKGSRDATADPGCVRFDLLRDRDDPNKFVFYEAYTDDDAAAFHKTTSHYKVWADFKASGAVVSQTVAKVATDSIPGGWAFQA